MRSGSEVARDRLAAGKILDEQVFDRIDVVLDPDAVIYLTGRSVFH